MRQHEGPSRGCEATTQDSHPALPCGPANPGSVLGEGDDSISWMELATSRESMDKEPACLPPPPGTPLGLVSLPQNHCSAL